jgi:hypothetical protein
VFGDRIDFARSIKDETWALRRGRSRLRVLGLRKIQAPKRSGRAVRRARSLDRRSGPAFHSCFQAIPFVTLLAQFPNDALCAEFAIITRIRARLTILQTLLAVTYLHFLTPDISFAIRMKPALHGRDLIFPSCDASSSAFINPYPTWGCPERLVSCLKSSLKNSVAVPPRRKLVFQAAIIRLQSPLNGIIRLIVSPG